MKHLILHIILICFSIGALFSQEQGNTAFIENKNQWEPFIKFKTEFKGGAIFFEENTITYVLQDRDAIEQILHRKFNPPTESDENDLSVTYHAYKVHYNNAQKPTAIIGNDPFSDYNNYYIGNDPSKWATRVPKYHAIKYENLYPGIDLHFYEKNQSLKYEFIVEKGIDPQIISMSYKGVDKLYIKQENLYIICGKNEIIELKPYAYQQNKSGDIIPVDCKFVLKGKNVYLNFGTYDKNLPLIIDPTLVFCSYSGSYVDNWGYTSTYDNEGNLYGGSSVFGISYPGFPTTTGAYQITYGGGSEDIGISKFNSTGSTLLYSTYLGGNGSEVPHSLIVNDNNELYVLASTSSSNFPVTSNAFDTSFNGGSNFTLTNVIQYLTGSDIVITKFNVNGTQLLGSTYFGGSGNDGLSTDTRLRKNYADEVRGEIMIDEFSNVYIVSSTNSSNLPTTSGSFQPTYGGGNQDGCVAKFNYDLSNLIWASYLGGDSSDAIYSMALDNNYNLMVCGGTYSRNLPTTFGCLQTAYAGGVSDGFIFKISTNGNQILQSTYIGKSTFDQAYLIKLDRQNDVYVMGLTDATGMLWIQNATWYNSGGGQFISKISSDLSQIIWSTAFGSGRIGPDISPTALMVDLCKCIYISGWGSPKVNAHVGNTNCGTSGLPISVDAFQTTTDNNDFYFISIDENASKLIFATYFGGASSDEHVDGGTSRFDKKGCIYQAICSSCGGRQDLPVTPGVVSQSNNSTNCNLGVVKIDFLSPSVVADFACPSIICAPYTINFDNRSQVISSATSTFFWDFGDGITSTLKNPAHTYTKSGIFKIKLIVADTGSCNFSDTLIKELLVLSNTKDTLPAKYMCKDDFIQIGITPSGNPNVSYNWLPSSYLSNPNIANPIASNPNTITYSLFITDGYCIDTFTQVVNVIPVYLDAGLNDTICLGDTILLQASTVGGTEYIWSSNRYFSDTLNSPLSNPVGKDVLMQSKKYYVKLSNPYCSLVDSVNITESHIIIVTPYVSKICINDSIHLTAIVNNAQAGKKLTYSWQPISNIIYGSNTFRPLVCPDKPMNYYVSVKNEFGCESMDSVFVDTYTIDYTIIKKDIRCYGYHDGYIRIDLDSASMPCTFLWKDDTGVENEAKNLPKGNYSVYVTDTHDCVYNIDVSLVEPPALNSYFFDTNTLVYCNDSCSGYVSAGGSGGVPPYSYWWITGDTTTSIKDLCAGEYVFVLKDKNLCEDTAKIFIRDTSNLNVSYLITHISCYGECDGSISLFPSDGLAPYVFDWKNGYNKDTASNLCTGIYDILVKDMAHCTKRVFPIIRTPLPLIFSEIEMIQPNCYGFNDGKIIAHICGGTPPYRFYWDGVKGNDSLTNLTEGTYHLKVIDTNDCEIDTILTLLQFDSLDISYQVIKTPCVEACYGQAMIQVNGGKPPYYCIWPDGDTSMHKTGLCYGNHDVNIYDSNGCRKLIHILVEDSSYFTQKVDAWTDSAIIYRSQSTTLYVTDLGTDFTYEWSPAEELSNPKGIKTIAKPNNTTTYTVIVTDSYGCKEFDTLTISVLDVICDEPYIFIPNAFSPNKDNNNDVLYVRGKLLTDIHLAIFDRWGEKVFETNDIKKGWDGTFKGKPCEPGIYVYYLEATCLGQINYFKKGNVTLIR
jgi:gliding motility-associated-like protein